MTARPAAYYRDYRERRKAIGGRRLTQPVESTEAAPDQIPDAPTPVDPATAIAEWSGEHLTVPPGAPRAGEAMRLPEFARLFLADALAPTIREGGLFCARKNSKTATIAILLLAHLHKTGPLRRRGWRGGVVSLSHDKTLELWNQCEEIAIASGIRGDFFFGKQPRIIKSEFGQVQFLSADGNAGQSLGLDMAVADELGIFPEKSRSLIQGMRQATGGRDGKLICISVIGDSVLAQELIERGETLPSTVCHIYKADNAAEFDHEEQWHKANPGLRENIKSLTYMRDAAQLAATNPNELPAFLVYELCLPASPDRRPIVSADRWALCADREQTPREGRCFVGLDAGGSTSMCAACIYWPSTGRIEAIGGFGDEPDLLARGKADAVGALYQRMADKGFLRTFPGIVTPVPEFLDWLREHLDGFTPSSILADGYRKGEVRSYIHNAGLAWPIEFRREGAGPDGFEDVRLFQKAVLQKRLRPGQNLLLEHAISESKIEDDRRGNPIVDKRRRNGRIDALSAGLLSVGAGERWRRSASPAPSIHIPLDPYEPISTYGV